VDGEPEVEEAGEAAFGSTVTILFSDIRGFTEFTDRHGDESAYRMLRIHNALVQEQLALYRGHVVKTQGDSFMVSFDSARTAVTCAIAIQKAVRATNQGQDGGGIGVGIGINTGEPVREGADFFGGTVNLASRICAVAEPGQVLVSETVRAVTGKMEGTAFEDRGDFELKGFQEPQRLYAVVEAPEEETAPVVAAAPAAAAPEPAPKHAPGHRPSPSVSGPIPAGTMPAGKRPVWLVPAVAALVLLLLAGSGAWVFLHRGGGAGNGAPGFPHGKLLYQARAAEEAWSQSSPPSPDPDGSAAVSYPGSSIHLNLLAQSGSLGGELNAPALKNYALELVLSADPGSDFEISWSLRSSDEADLSLHIDLPSESMGVIYGPYNADSVEIISNISLAGIQSGKQVTIGLVADGTHLTLYRNGVKVGEAEESGANGGTTPGFYMDGNGGSLHLDAIRYYAVR
jgi:class 3 adenylate cyclase